MTARRRRRSGSGPSAAALIAWAGGVNADYLAGPPHAGSRTSSASAGSSSSASRTGRARGLAAGALVACGSVLAVAVHAADNTVPQAHGDDTAWPGLATAPGSAPAAGGTTPLTMAARSAEAPAASRLQSLGGPTIRAGNVHRNVPLFVGDSAAMWNSRAFEAMFPAPTAPMTDVPAPAPGQALPGAPLPDNPLPGAPDTPQPVATPLEKVGQAATGLLHGATAPVTGETGAVASVVQQIPPTVHHAQNQLDVVGVAVPRELAGPLDALTRPALTLLAPQPAG